MKNGISIYVQVLLIIGAIVLGLLVMQACVNLHSTAMLVLGVLFLLGLPIGVAYLLKRINHTLTKEVNTNENS